jgi:hypothetical protein
MKRHLFNLAATIFVICGLFSCSEDEEKAPLEGTWQGTSAHAKFYPEGSPIAVYDEDLPDFTPVIEFKEDGTASVLVDGTVTNGTWEYADGEKKLVANVDLQNDFFGASETFTIKSLTDSSLELEYIKEGDVDVPDVGVVEGRLELLLKFSRVE